MKFIRWFIALLILIYLMSLIFRVGGILINILLLIAVFLFIFDALKIIKKDL
ncbi:MAG: hypothetical protein ACM3X7_02365 [Solirubrobacterales bacterium]